MNHHLRTALAAAATLSVALLMSSCGDSDTTSTPQNGTSSATLGSSSATLGSGKGEGNGNGGSEAAASPGGSAASGTSGGTSGASSGASGTSKGTSGAGKKGGTGDKRGYGQVCGANDISWSVASKSQAGGYFLIQAKAKSGITCTLPAALPTVAFGSDGTEADPAEQVVGDAITLRAGVTAYAGVKPKTTNNNYGKELDSLIVAVGEDDPNPVSLRVGKFMVDKPIVTNWHTSAAKAVPFSS